MKILLLIVSLNAFIYLSHANLGIHLKSNEGKITAEQSIKIKLLNDIIMNSFSQNLVLICKTDDLNDFIEDSFGKKENATMSFMFPDMVNDEVIEKLKALHLKDNTANLYIIMVNDQDDETITDLLKRILDADYLAKVVVIYDNVIDVDKKYSRKKMYNMFILAPVNIVDDEKKIIYQMSEICRFCNMGKDSIRKINTWSYTKSFHHHLQLPLSFKNRFFGAEVAIGVYNSYPNLFAIGKNEKGVELYAGPLYRDYVMMARIMDLEWKFNRTWDNAPTRFNTSIKDLNDGYIDVIGSKWVCRYDRYLLADVSTLEAVNPGYAIVSIEPLKGLQWNSIFTTFDSYTWIFTLLSIPACGLTLYICHEFSINPARENSFLEFMWELIVILCWEGVTFRTAPPWSMLFVYTAYLLVCFMLITFYIGEFTAIVAIPLHVTPPIETLEQLWATDMKFVSGYEPLTRFWFIYFDDVLDIKERHEEVAGPDGPWPAALRELLQNPDDYVFLDSEIASNYFIEKFALEANTTRKYWFSKERFNPTFTVMYYKKGCYFKDALNMAIMTIQELGLSTYHWEANEMPGIVANAVANPEPPTKIDYLKFEHLLVPNLIFTGCLLVALIALGLEILYWRL